MEKTMMSAESHNVNFIDISARINKDL